MNKELQGIKEKSRLLQFGYFSLQLFVVFCLVQLYQFEASSGLPQLMMYWSGAALINFWTPPNWRHHLLVVTTAVTIVHALGIVSGGVFFLITGSFAVIAHLPLSRRLRLVLLLLMVLLAALIRLQYFYMPRVYAAIPLAGTFLMFRFILYWHELKHEKSAVKWPVRLSYLYNPLNAAFPLFPVIDYKTWQRSHYEEPEYRTYAIGFRRIFSGLFLMLVFRITYNMNPNPANIQTAGQLMLYLVLAYAFILRLLGMYWFVIGMLGLFGFNMPPVFDQVFFITRFSQIWRKINMYWKEFITKIVYYPIYFRVRKTWPIPLFFAGILSFLATWFFHNWQFFWLKGHFPLRLTDLLYWMILGIVISTTMLLNSTQNNSTPQQNNFKNTLVQTLRAAGIFIFMCVLWSLWSSETIGEWAHLLSHATVLNAGAIKFTGILLGIALIAGVIYHNRAYYSGIRERFATLELTLVIAILCGILLAPGLHSKFVGENPFVRTLLAQPFNEFDKENAEQGYYEQLGTSGSGNPWEVPMAAGNKGKWFSIAEEGSNDLRMRKLKATFTVSDSGRTFTTNSFGMRGPEITEHKPSGILRIAILGASYEMGSGVSDEEVFSRVLEVKLNQWMVERGSNTRIQILNFSVGAYHLPQYAWLCDHQLFRFEPDFVFSFAHSSEERRLNAVTARLVQNGQNLSEYPELEKIRQMSGAKQTMSRTEIRNRIYPYNRQLLRWGYSYVASSVQSHNAVPVWVYLPALSDEPSPSEIFNLSKEAQLCGFQTLSLGNVYSGQNNSLLKVSEDDAHPNAKGHSLIAETLFQSLTKAEWFITRADSSR